MTKETIDYCLDFAEGCKGKFTIYMARRPGFPATLISGTEKQQIINDYRKRGFTTKEIAEKMGCSQPNIVEHMRQYKRSAAFYAVWCEFWDFCAEVRKVPVARAFKDILGPDALGVCTNKGVITVGDFLSLAVTTSSDKVFKTLKLNAEKKSMLFDRIREMCYDLITVSGKSHQG